MCSTHRVCPLLTFFDLPTLQRKLDDVLQSLDDALGPQEPSTERPKKRPHLVRTLYSTLVKYGIKTKDSTPSVSLLT